MQITRRLTRSTLNNTNLHIPKYRNNRLQLSIKYQGVKVWNSIPPEITKLPTNSFIQKLKNITFNLMKLRLKRN